MQRRLSNALIRTTFTLGLAVAASSGTVVLGGRSNSLLDISADGRWLACSNRDSGTLTVVAREALEKLHEVPVGKKPEGVSFLGASSTIAVAVYAEDRVVFVDAASGKATGAVEVEDEPYGVVSNADGSKLYVTLEYPGKVVEIDASEKCVTRTFEAGAFPRGIALTTGGRQLLVVEYYTSRVRAIELETGTEVSRWEGASTDNLARQIAVHPGRPKAYLAHIRSRVIAAHGEGSIFPYVSVLDTDLRGGPSSREEPGRRRVPMDAFRSNFVVANPWEVTVSPDGRRLFAVFSGTDDLFACDVIDDDYREISYRRYAELGKNPRAVRVSSDGRRLYVYNALDFEVVAHDADNLRLVGKVRVTQNPLGEEVLAGKILFYSARQPMVERRWISCSSCHPDGDPDGRTWNNPEGLRNTPALHGLAWTHPLHWSADRDETQDFEHTIRGPLMQGRGLIEGKVRPSLGEPNKGLSARLDALAAYTNSHEFTLSPHAKGGLNEAARRGRALFFSEETLCSTCHRGAFYADSTPTDETIRHDVGTGEADPSETMGPAYDTPTLLGVYRTAPYLHHGKARTLAEVLRKYNPEDRHGKTSHLDDAQVGDVVEFLMALPFEDPVPSAQKAGLPRVER